MSTFKLSPDKQLKEILLGCAELVSEEELLAKLEWSYQNDQPLKVKFGADPSRPDIHLGHTVVLHKLRCFQELGHSVIFIVGDFTARIGDPTGRSKTRPELSPEEIAQNAKTYEEQVFKILDRDATRVVFNSEWLNALTPMDFVRLAATRTVQQLLAREDFQNRFQQQTPIFLHELLYPVMQAYDSVVLEADVELGGTDQTFNLLLARELQRHHGLRPQTVLTMPILEGLDGVQKMSKSLDNYIGVTEPPGSIFGKTMSVSDQHMIRFYELLGQLSDSEFEKLKSGVADQTLHPMELKKRLAQMLVARFWGEAAGAEARTEFESVFSRREVPDDLPEHQVTTDDDGMVDLISVSVSLGFSKSRSEARRVLRQNGMKLDGKVVTQERIQIGQASIFKQGKIKMAKLVP